MVVLEGLGRWEGCGIVNVLMEYSGYKFVL